MISISESTEPDIEWNKRLIDSGFGTIYQTIERANFIKNSGSAPIFLKFFDDTNRIVAQLLVITYSRFSQNGLKSKIFQKSPGVKKIVCNWAYGPIFFDNKLTSEVYLTLEKYLISKGFVPNGWTHPLFPGIPTTNTSFRLQKWGTYIINLQLTKDEIYSKIAKHNGRKNIERSIKRGVVVEELTEDTLYDFYELKNSMRKSAGEQTTKIESLQRRWKTFSALGFSGFIAKKENIPIGGLLFTYLNGHIIEIGVARSSEDTSQNLYAQDLIKWKIIEWGIKNNMKYYDLTGFNPEPISKKEEGIARYKKKWGGKPYFYYRILNKPSFLSR